MTRTRRAAGPGTARPAIAPATRPAAASRIARPGIACSPRRPDYFRVWRQAHAATERARRLRWRLTHPDLLREQWRRRAQRRRVEVVPLPPSHAHHALFDRAWEVLHRLGVRRDDHLASIHDPRWEDACSEAVLAILEGRDPEAAARRVLATERRLSILSVRIDDLERLPAGA